ncbi:MAG: Hpt domain-containing protein [Marinifilaceae bacterium]|jgi:HPt (histidine-containing phosphotransfer) domain-containing protein|nr:Hpt domain-containing protein [Marinifilaceae bacterium]
MLNTKRDIILLIGISDYTNKNPKIFKFEKIEDINFDKILIKYRPICIICNDCLAASINSYLNKIKYYGFGEIYKVIADSEDKINTLKQYNINYINTYELNRVIEQVLNSKSPYVKPINFDELFKRVDNNKQFVATVMARFFELKTERIHSIKEQLIVRNYDEAHNLSHKLKGVLANFSMNIAKNKIIELENNLKFKNYKLAEENLESLDILINDCERYFNESSSIFSS